MRPLFAALPLALALAPAARAQCLTAADLDTGIHVTFANADWTEIRRIGPDLYEVEEYYANAGYGGLYVAYFGIVAMQGFWDYRADQPDIAFPYRRAFDTDPHLMLDPAQVGAKWQGSFTEIGGTPPDENEATSALSVAVTAAPTVDVPGCSYAATLVETRIDFANPDPGGTVNWLFYMPDLGTAVLFAAQQLGGNVISSPIVDIEALGEL